MIRVDQAGEFGAVRIYEGQLAVLGARNSQTTDAIRHMAEQEQRHPGGFDEAWTTHAPSVRRRSNRFGAWPDSRWAPPPR